MRTAAHIIETVGKLVKKYDTRDPYELCKCLEIKIHFYNLGCRQELCAKMFAGSG